MASFMRRFRRKRKVSSEMHDRWGDLSISSPNEGSWSGCPSVSTPDVSPEPRWRNSSLDSIDRPGISHQKGDLLRPKTAGDRTVSIDSAMTMPTGHYDASVRRRQKSKSKYSGPGLGIGELKNGRTVWGNSTLAGESSDEDDEPHLTTAPLKGRHEIEAIRTARSEDADYNHRASKSPPLSVTSRMRHSIQSNTTATTDTPIFTPRTISSKHTSFTSSVPSVPAEDPRLHNAAYHEKKNAHRSIHKHREPDSNRQQQLVPSYDDLYG